MVNLMEKKNYDLTQITRVLLEIRDNCVPKDGEAYDDPKRMEKYDALNAAIDLINNPSQFVTGDTSDGYHTFNELYHHRAVLFSVIVKAFQEKAWKARLHHDGTMYDGMFVVGIDTPEGQASYHYDIDPYWDMFECREMERAPKWDGHTPAQAIERIGRLEPVRIGCLGVAGEEHYRALECLEKMQFFMGQRAGRELWMSKPKNVQDVDIEQYNHDIETVMHYIQQLENQIGEFAENLELAKQENAGLCIMLTAAQSAAETWKRNYDDAVDDLDKMGEYRQCCETCIYNNIDAKEEPCMSCCEGYLVNNWKWRGVKEYVKDHED